MERGVWPASKQQSRIRSRDSALKLMVACFSEALAATHTSIKRYNKSDQHQQCYFSASSPKERTLNMNQTSLTTRTDFIITLTHSTPPPLPNSVDNTACFNDP